MRNRVSKIASLLLILAVMAVSASAESMISTTLVMRISHMTQNAVVDVGQDLSMEVDIDGLVPEAYQWYFNGVPISGADQKVYSIVNAQVEDAGLYRIDAFDGDGKMLVSMEVSARVLDQTVPKSGDSSMPVRYALLAMAAAALTLTAMKRRGAEA